MKSHGAQFGRKYSASLCTGRGRGSEELRQGSSVYLGLRPRLERKSSGTEPPNLFLTLELKPAQEGWGRGG